MGIFEKVKGAPSVPVPTASPVVEAADSADPTATEKHREGESVKLPDAGPGVYRDRAGLKLGGGPMEGTSYAGEIAKQARLSVEQAEAAELAALEKELARETSTTGR